jgi:hypothetical protein
MWSKPCCQPSTCCPGGAKGAGGVLALAVAIVAVAILEHILLLVAVAGAIAACWVIAIAVVMVIARYTVKPPAIAPQPESYRVTATVIPQAVRAERVREVPAPAPAAIENHWHLHLDGQSVAQLAALINGREPVRTVRAIPGQAGDAITSEETR